MIPGLMVQFYSSISHLRPVKNGVLKSSSLYLNAFVPLYIHATGSDFIQDLKGKVDQTAEVSSC